MPVNVIGTLKPKNNGKFPVAEAVDIKVTDNQRLDEALENKADLSTVNFALDNKADKTITTNLQSQIDEIITPVTQDAEVQNARIGTNGTPYNTLKSRLDFENATINENIRSIEECIGNLIVSSDIYSQAGSWEIDRQFIECNIYKGNTYNLVIDVPKNYANSSDSVVLNVRTTRTNSNPQTVDEITGEIRGLLAKGRHSFNFTASNDAEYLYIYIRALEQPVNLTVSLYNAKTIRDEIEYLNESLYRFAADDLGTIDYYNPNEIVRTYIPQLFVAGKKYTLLFKFAEDYTSGSNYQVTFNARTSTDENSSTIVDQITQEIKGSVGSNELVYNFTPTADANYLYVYSHVAQEHFVCEIRIIGEDIKTVVDKYSSGTRSPYKYSGERVSMKQYSYDMNLKYKTLKPSLIDNAWQGCAAYGDYLFRFFHTGVCAVYNAESGGSAISTFELGSHGSDNHANNANFGSNKYDVNDEFPLLYVTDGDSGEVMRCAVERIVRSNDTFTATKVQTINLDQTDFESRGLIPYWGWSAWLIADDALYYFGCKYRSNGSQSSHDAENVYIITKFDIPDLSSPAVTLTAADVKEQWTSSYDTELTQGGCIYNDYLFYAFGMGDTQYPSAIKVFSLSQKTSIAKILLTDTPLRNTELEDLTVRNNKLIIAAQSEDIYEIDFA